MTTIHFKAKPGDWLLSDKLLREAVDDLVKAEKVNSSFDIPYLAGYSIGGETIYIDRHLPEWKSTFGSVDICRFLVLHEVVEKGVMELSGMPYQLCHQIALHAERDAVESAGYNWDDYNTFCMKQCKRAGDERLTKVPKDLDLTPYKDERDFATIKRIVAAGGK